MSELANSDTCPRPATGAAAGRVGAGQGHDPRPAAGRRLARAAAAARRDQGLAALPRCTAAYPLYTRFTNITNMFGALFRFTPDSLTCSVPVFLSRRCDRTPGSTLEFACADGFTGPA